MKKLLIVLLLALAMTAALTACGEEPAEEPAAGEEQTQEEEQTPAAESIASLADLEAAFGHAVANFGDRDLEGYTAEEFSLSEDGVAQVRYVKEGTEMVVSTAAGTDGNISGVDTQNLEVREYDSNGTTVQYALVENDTYIAYWTDGEYSYSLYETEEIEETYLQVLIDYLTEGLSMASEESAV